MRRDDRDDPFDDIFREIERMMEEMTGGDVSVGRGAGSDAHLRVDEEDDRVRVVGDFPGVRREDIDVKCDGHVLTVSAEGDAGSFRERLSLPAKVDAHSATASFNNGVLEVVLEREDDSASIDL
jgi:HSP20 family protein